MTIKDESENKSSVAKLFDRTNITVTVSSITLSLSCIAQGFRRHSALDLLTGAACIVAQVFLFMSYAKSEKNLRDSYGVSDAHEIFMRKATMASVILSLAVDCVLLSMAMSKRDLFSIFLVVFAVVFQLFAVFYKTDVRKVWIG